MYKKHSLFLFIAVAYVTLFAQTAMCAREAMIAHVNLFNDTDRCNCTGCSTIYDSWSDNYSGYLFNKVSDWYDNNTNSRVAHPTNKGVSFNEWADFNRDTDGNDNGSNGVDSFDVGFIMTHGNVDIVDNPWPWPDEHVGSHIVLGDGTEECTLYYGDQALPEEPDAQWGDADLNYLFIHACHSLEHDVFEDGHYNSTDMRSPNLNMLAGFHGNVLAGSFYYDNFKGYVNGVQWTGIGEDWVDELTVMLPYSNGDNCAAALIFAGSNDDAEDIYMYGGFEDYQSINYGTGVRQYWAIEDCHPSGAAPITF